MEIPAVRQRNDASPRGEAAGTGTAWAQRLSRAGSAPCEDAVSSVSPLDVKYVTPTYRQTVITEPRVLDQPKVRGVSEGYCWGYRQQHQQPDQHHLWCFRWLRFSCVPTSVSLALLPMPLRLRQELPIFFSSLQTAKETFSSWMANNFPPERRRKWLFSS